MRKPTTRVQLLQNWRALLDGRGQFLEDDPCCGFYRTRFVKNGPWVPVRIECIQITDEFGELTEPEELVAVVACGGQQKIGNLWGRLRPIPEEAYWSLMHSFQTDEAFAATHAPVSDDQLLQRP